MKQRSNPLSWMDIYPGELAVDEFPDGSFRFTVNCDEVPERFFVTLKSTLPEAIIAAYQVCTAICGTFSDSEIQVDVQTMPDQRADRIEVPGMTNAAVVSAQLLGNLPCDYLVVYDLHSPVTAHVLQEVCAQDGKELEIYEPIDCFVDTLYDVWPDEYTPRFDVVVAVDKGAVERSHQIRDHFGCQVIYADKKRVDGKVVGHEFVEPREFPADDATIWIVDDLCDGGATFISIAKLLRETYKFGELNLYVTHGLFSKGKEELYQHYDNILARFDYSGAN